MTAVLIVDDHPVVLSGFRRLMEDAGVGTVHEASDVVGAYRLFHRLRPPMVVADLTFQGKGLSGLALIQRIHALDRRTRILAFSMHNDPFIVSRALECGAIGYVFKDVRTAEFLRAFHAVRAGEGYLDHGLAIAVAILHAAPRRSPVADLNAREKQILSLLSKGTSYQDIAEALSIKYRTVINSCSTMRQKLGVGTLAELIQVAVRQADATEASGWA
ncbi:response regulator transcription factor [Methylobacterium sp. Leaf466]|uniref:response regulator transcription factor n=1 Tax=Methylobacterium sp. Leaf466 TaxID=1736386 RepID=UPI0006FB568E|nr:response regulator transcription factor [Methylobacterium sp. Leaf466]KQT90256.1 two-component system response regulator [Methylobacterium sp. Leaf466]